MLKIELTENGPIGELYTERQLKEIEGLVVTKLDSSLVLMAENDSTFVGDYAELPLKYLTRREIRYILAVVEAKNQEEKAEKQEIETNKKRAEANKLGMIIGSLEYAKNNVTTGGADFVGKVYLGEYEIEHLKKLVVKTSLSQSHTMKLLKELRESLQRPSTDDGAREVRLEISIIDNLLEFLPKLSPETAR